METQALSLPGVSAAEVYERGSRAIAAASAACGAAATAGDDDIALGLARGSSARSRPGGARRSAALPLVCVLTPDANGAHPLSQLLPSALGALTRYRVLLVTLCATDGSRERISRGGSAQLERERERETVYDWSCVGCFLRGVAFGGFGDLTWCTIESASGKPRTALHTLRNFFRSSFISFDWKRAFDTSGGAGARLELGADLVLDAHDATARATADAIKQLAPVALIDMCGHAGSALSPTSNKQAFDLPHSCLGELVRDWCRGRALHTFDLSHRIQRRVLDTYTVDTLCQERNSNRGTVRWGQADVLEIAARRPARARRVPVSICTNSTLGCL